MGLFLSKLLPLFVYPLGLACGLLVLALILLWQRPRWAAGAIATALALLLIASSTWTETWLVSSLERQYRSLQPIPSADAIVVLGGGVRPSVPPRPWVEVAEAGDRILYGAHLLQQGKAPLLILSGGRIDWKEGGPPESSDMATLAMAMGVPKTAILEDPTSLNTYQNAVNVKAILDQRQLKRILLVTSASHMPRSIAIFRRQGIEAIPVPTDFLISDQSITELQTTSQAKLLAILPDAAHLYNVSRAMKEYLGLLVYRLRGWL